MTVLLADVGPVAASPEAGGAPACKFVSGRSVPGRSVPAKSVPGSESARAALLAVELVDTDGLALAVALALAVGLALADDEVLGNAVLGNVVAQNAAVLLETSEPATARIRKQYWMEPPRPVIW